MQKPKFLNLIGTSADVSQTADAKAGARAQTLQRLQVGVAGILVMLLVIGLAATLTQRAQIVEDSAVPDAAPTTEPEEVEPQSDPLADAGVLPEIPDDAEEAEGDAAAGETAIPETGEGGEAEIEDTEAQ